MTSLRTDKEIGNLWAWFWLVVFRGEEKFWVSWERQAQGRSALRPSKVGTQLIKTCFLPHKSLDHIKGCQVAEAQFAWLQIP